MLPEFLNNVFYSSLSGINVAIAFLMFFYYSVAATNWNRISKIGFLSMAAGLLLQSICIIDDITLDDAFFLQFWAVKDIGIAIYTVGLLQAWVSSK